MLTSEHRHPRLIGIKAHLIDAIHGRGPIRTADVADVADAVGTSRAYTCRMLNELHAEGVVTRAPDGEHVGRGQASHVWSCCGDTDG